MNGWAVAFWIAAVATVGAVVVACLEDRLRRDELHQKQFLQRWINSHFKGTLNSPYEQARRQPHA